MKIVTDCLSSIFVLTFRLRDRVVQGMVTEEVAKVALMTDWWTPVWSKALQREFPPPAMFDYLNVNHRSQDAIDAWIDAPWFAGMQLQQAKCVNVTSKARVGCYLACRWERWRHSLGGDFSAL